jgi:hypothetical protein
MSMDTDIGLDGQQLVPLIILNNNQHIYHHSVTKAKFFSTFILMHGKINISFMLYKMITNNKHAQFRSVLILIFNGIISIMDFHKESPLLSYTRIRQTI